MSQLALLDAAVRSPRQTAVIDDQGTYTYGDLLQSSGRISARLLQGETDLKQQRIAFLVEPGFDYVAVQWGIWRAGGIAVPLGMKHPPPELDYVIADADVSAVVVGPDLVQRVQSITTARAVPLMTTDEFQPAASAVNLPGSDASRGAMILYTSGSTGRPKGVLTTHANIQAQMDSLVEAWRWQPADHILNVLPMHHIHGIINVLGCAMRVGAVCEFMPSFDAARVWDRLATGDLTLFMAVPTIYAKLISHWASADPDCQHRWSLGTGQLRLMVSGSAALPVSTLQQWESMTGQRLLERYGMTEIGMALSNRIDGERRAGHVGQPLPSVEVRRTNDAGQLVDDKTPGEIEVRGPTVFQQYWQRPEETRTAFRDGWFRTGDVAIVDDGDYRILGRNSVDIIKSGGYKISALEIEDTLRNHPVIRDCAVVGVADDEWGERVALCAVTESGSTLQLDELRAWAKEQLASYKVPSLLVVCDELPRNAMGKVQKPKIGKMFCD